MTQLNRRSERRPTHSGSHLLEAGSTRIRSTGIRALAPHLPIVASLSGMRFEQNSSARLTPFVSTSAHYLCDSGIQSIRVAVGAGRSCQGPLRVIFSRSGDVCLTVGAPQSADVIEVSGKQSPPSLSDWMGQLSNLESRLDAVAEKGRGPTWTSGLLLHFGSV